MAVDPPPFLVGRHVDMQAHGKDMYLEKMLVAYTHTRTHTSWAPVCDEIGRAMQVDLTQ